MSFAKSGKVAFVGQLDTHSQIFVADADGQNSQAITHSGGEYISSPSISPDGTKVAFVVAPGGGKEDTATREIYVIGVDGTGQTQITNNKFEDSYPAWSPDGKQLAFASDPTGRKNLQIFVSGADGSNPQQLTFNRHNTSPSWSPDGKRIAFVSTRDRNENIYIMEVANSLNTNILTYDGGASSNRSPNWSADGVYIVFSSNCNCVGNVYQLYVTTPSGNLPRKSQGRTIRLTV